MGVNRKSICLKCRHYLEWQEYDGDIFDCARACMPANDRAFWRVVECNNFDPIERGDENG